MMNCKFIEVNKLSLQLFAIDVVLKEAWKKINIYFMLQKQELSAYNVGHAFALYAPQTTLVSFLPSLNKRTPGVVLKG